MEKLQSSESTAPVNSAQTAQTADDIRKGIRIWSIFGMVVSLGLTAISLVLAAFSMDAPNSTVDLAQMILLVPLVLFVLSIKTMSMAKGEDVQAAKKMLKITWIAIACTIFSPFLLQIGVIILGLLVEIYTNFI